MYITQLEEFCLLMVLFFPLIVIFSCLCCLLGYLILVDQEVFWGQVCPTIEGIIGKVCPSILLFSSVMIYWFSFDDILIFDPNLLQSIYIIVMIAIVTTIDGKDVFVKLGTTTKKKLTEFQEKPIYTLTSIGALGSIIILIINAVIMFKKIQEHNLSPLTLLYFNYGELIYSVVFYGLLIMFYTLPSFFAYVMTQPISVVNKLTKVVTKISKPSAVFLCFFFSFIASCLTFAGSFRWIDNICLFIVAIIVMAIVITILSMWGFAYKSKKKENPKGLKVKVEQVHLSTSLVNENNILKLVLLKTKTKAKIKKAKKEKQQYSVPQTIAVVLLIALFLISFRFTTYFPNKQIALVNVEKHGRCVIVAQNGNQYLLQKCSEDGNTINIYTAEYYEKTLTDVTVTLKDFENVRYFKKTTATPLS